MLLFKFPAGACQPVQFWPKSKYWWQEGSSLQPIDRTHAKSCVVLAFAPRRAPEPARRVARRIDKNRFRRGRGGFVPKWTKFERIRRQTQRFASTDHCRCVPPDASTSWSSCPAICVVFDAQKVPDTLRKHLGREPADGRRGLVRPRPSLSRGPCGLPVHQASRSPPRAAGSPQRAPWGALRGQKQSIFA